MKIKFFIFISLRVLTLELSHAQSFKNLAFEIPENPGNATRRDQWPLLRGQKVHKVHQRAQFVYGMWHVACKPLRAFARFVPGAQFLCVQGIGG